MADIAVLLCDNDPAPAVRQSAASDPAASVWVNASAGSGKTTILVNRVTRLLLAGVKPEKILCLTFTRAAAAEMALRVTSKLSLWAVCAENDLSAGLADLQDRAPTPKEMTRARRLFAEMLACPGGMRIRTIHAFGQEVLRRFPIESSLPPHFAVIEEGDARVLQDDILNDLLRETAETPENPVSTAVAFLIGALGEKGFRDAARNVLCEKTHLAKALQRHGSIEALIARMRSALGLQPGDTEENLLRAAFAPPQFDEDGIREAARLLLKGTPLYSKRGAAILGWLELDANDRVRSYGEYKSAFLTKDGDFFKNYGDKNLIAAHPDLDAVLRREATRLQMLAERREVAATAEITVAILHFGQALTDCYQSRKRARAALDYDDLVDEALNLLRRPGIAPWVLHKLDSGIDHLLVDEAQDTSRAQWDIVSLLAEEFFSGATARNNDRTLFVVGDEKQSIYSFQNADPEAFISMRSYFKEKIAAAGKSFKEMPLHVSYRSAPAILRAVDAVFAGSAAEGVSSGTVAHVSHKPDRLFGRVELLPLLSQPDKDETGLWQLPVGYESERDPQAELAHRIAAQIKGWIARGETLPGTNHPIRPGDIMILLRRRGRFADLMVRALKREPNLVPVTGVDRMRLMQQLPVMDLCALIQFTLLPEDDLNLAAVLRGPLLNLGEDDLMKLAAGRGGISLWQSLKNHVAGAEIFKTAHDYLAAWLNRADFMTPFAMLSHMLNEPCPGGASGRRALWSRLGHDALDPIEELLNAAQNFSRRHVPSLQAFLHWLTASDSEIKRELDIDKDAGQVRIMTVHASKGLEAPIVFLPDTANVPRPQDVPNFLWDEGLPFYIASKPDAGLPRQIWNVARRKQLEEYRRLLYVAMTRASRRLYIGGWELKKKDADGDGCWHNLIRDGLKESEAHARSAEDAIVWEDPAPRGEITAQKPVTAPDIALLPSWAFEPVPVEEAETKALAPSKLAAAPSAATPDAAYARGRIIHRLLQSLPDLEESKREAATGYFLAHPQHGLKEEEQKTICDEVMRLLRHPDYAPFFGPQSQAEVPLAGLIEGRKSAGQVDRLVLHEGEVWIVDYKTSRPPPAEASAIPEIYRVQMEAYRALLRQIYPGRPVRCFLLWTYGPKLMEITPKY